MRTRLLIALALALVAAFAAGFYADRWLHRPITLHASYQRYRVAVIPPCIATCEPTQEPGTTEGDDVPDADPDMYRILHAYGDRPGEESTCRWYHICQQET